MGPFFSKKGLQNSVSKASNSVTRPSLLPAASKSAAGRRSRQSPLSQLRLIIDLSVLNHFVYTQTFKMETQRKVKDAIQLNDWAFSLDRTDAYLHVPIHPRSRKYLRFTLRGRVYQFKALPFGLSTSPFVFTHLMNVIATFLRRRAITLHPYLDDWLA